MLRRVTFQPDVISKFRFLVNRHVARNIETLCLGTSGGSVGVSLTSRLLNYFRRRRLRFSAWFVLYFNLGLLSRLAFLATCRRYR